MATGINDPKLYRELNVPRTAAELDEQCEGFNKELRELRIKYKLPDVYCICRVTVLGEDGEEGDVMMRFHNGSGLLAESMTAWAYGYEASQRLEMIAAIAKGKKRAN